MSKLCDLKSIKEAIRNKYAWPGGYPLYLVTNDGEALSINSAREIWRDIVSAHKYDGSRWNRIAAININYEDSSLYCFHSGERIESAYSDDSGEE
jgi:hypothetical protein